MKKWSNEELLEAVKLCKSGLRYREIAGKINRTERAVKNKLEEFKIQYSTYNTIEKENCKCLNCNSIFVKQSSSKRKFCTQSCATIFNNKKKKKNSTCKECRNEIKFHKVYCNNECQQKFQRKLIFEKIEKGIHATVGSKIFKTYLIEKFGEQCMKCSWKDKNEYSNKIPVELHHIDCNPDNNKINNLQLLCPNCHSLTKNWKGITQGSGRYSRRRKKRREDYKNGKAH